jgi:hypothetical protein
VTHPRGLNELYLQLKMQGLSTTTKPDSEEPRSGKRIAAKARHRQARQLGNL